MMRPRIAYQELLRRSREQVLLDSCSALLSWDEQTYMPRSGAAHRAQQLALLAGLRHERATDPRTGELLGELEGSDLLEDPEAPEAVNVREWRRNYDRLTRLPRALVEDLTRATTLAQQAWIEARREREFSGLRPHLESIVAMKRREAECLGFGETAYDALLDEYEPGATGRELAVVFDALRRELEPLLGMIAESRRRPDPTILRREYPVDRQRQFGLDVAAALGFDFESGRLDPTDHPFCTLIGPGDCRITTRYDATDFGQAFFGVLHEVGHGLYDQGLDPAHYGTPMGEAASLGIHESQSRLWENAVGRSRAFWEFWFPRARRAFPEALRDVTLDQFHFAINHVQRSLNRIQADEVTYNLHIVARFELERALIDGDLPVSDLPGAWAEKYRHYLGLVPADDAEGCLQDIHWSAGLFGYFPTYTLGNLYAAQLFVRARDEIGPLDELFASGDYAPLLHWLRDRVHRHGHRYRPVDLIGRATVAPPDHGPLVKTLKEKYSQLYSS